VAKETFQKNKGRKKQTAGAITKIKINISSAITEQPQQHVQGVLATTTAIAFLVQSKTIGPSNMFASISLDDFNVRRDFFCDSTCYFSKLDVHTVFGLGQEQC